jgi:hypothetical protein
MVSVECDPGLFYLMLFHCSLALSRVERDQAGLIAVDALGADLAGFLGIECKIAEKRCRSASALWSTLN